MSGINIAGNQLLLKVKTVIGLMSLPNNKMICLDMLGNMQGGLYELYKKYNAGKKAG
ncbi:MAG: hypothetical protein HF978_21700 [Desulfobacteraceae bacterium]|nr:hypothetical protein [Desulfobacteraceae bacterium]MBC2758162.1 hypothetical protein [Desulfobacteraceae bacterium]